VVSNLNLWGIVRVGWILDGGDCSATAIALLTLNTVRLVDRTILRPLFLLAAGAKPPILGDFEEVGSPRIGGWGA
jgi:hypothetical protein